MLVQENELCVLYWEELHSKSPQEAVRFCCRDQKVSRSPSCVNGVTMVEPEVTGGTRAPVRVMAASRCNEHCNLSMSVVVPLLRCFRFQTGEIWYWSSREAVRGSERGAWRTGLLCRGRCRGCNVLAEDNNTVADRIRGRYHTRPESRYLRNTQRRESSLKTNRRRYLGAKFEKRNLRSLRFPTHVACESLLSTTSVYHPVDASALTCAHVRCETPATGQPARTCRWCSTEL